LDRNAVENTMKYARVFFYRHKLNPSCVILTATPSILDMEIMAELIARELGAAYINPDLVDLTTVDTAHLDPASAERWAAAFWQQADAVISRCLAQSALRLASA
jgi:hypothetical protein